MKSGTVKCYGQSFSFKKSVLQRKNKYVKSKKASKGQIIDEEIRHLHDRISKGINESNVSTFGDFPLSKATLNGLQKAKFVTPTDIQIRSLASALAGNDVLAAAKTGSGKTLSFLIPVLEVLHRAKVSPLFGMAALIITPTRELAIQIFEVLQHICTFHDFSSTFVVGERFYRREEPCMRNANIVVCTPGRLLQHFGHTVNFSAHNLRVLVLDEADRLMDSKFADDMDNIIQELPKDRQTLLFSATQTESVKVLARLSLVRPVHIASGRYAMPEKLVQNYVVCEQQEKLSYLFSFLKSHTKSKVLVFLQTCKQVRFFHQMMMRKSPGIPVLELHGGMKQLKRIENYRKFSGRLHCALFATDVACRGLDFAASINWVIQLDCPVDAETYIHRAGRTARCGKNGQALLVLLPSEEKFMMKELRRALPSTPINRINVNKKMLWDITGVVTSLIVSDVELKAMAERAVRNYIFSITLMKNKQIFDPFSLDIEAFAKSYGLYAAPKLRFLRKLEAKANSRKAERPVSMVTAPKPVPRVGNESRRAGENVHATSSLPSILSVDRDAINNTDTSSSNDTASDETDGDETDSSDTDGDDTDDDEIDSGDTDDDEIDCGDTDDDEIDSGDTDSDDTAKEATVMAGDEISGGEQTMLVRTGVQQGLIAVKASLRGSLKCPPHQLKDTAASLPEDDVSDGGVGSGGGIDCSGLFLLKEETSFPVDPGMKRNDTSKALPEKIKKPKSRVAVAKSQLKKGVRLNKRFVFDAEGKAIDALYDPLRQRRSCVEEEKCSRGGLNIAVAMKRMAEEAGTDKRIHRDRVKRQRLEKKIKNEGHKFPKGMRRREKKRDVELSEGNIEQEVDPLAYIPDPDNLSKRLHNATANIDDDDGDDGTASNSLQTVAEYSEEGSDDGWCGGDNGTLISQRSVEDEALRLLRSSRK